MRHPLRAPGGDDFADFAQAKAKGFATFLDLDHGVPSADTFRRVLSRLAPDAFEHAFTTWMSQVVELSEGKRVAIDGKSIRRSFDHAWDKAGMAHRVSAYATHEGQVFAQVRADGKGRELDAIGQRLGLIDLKGATVSIDALGTKKPVAQRILDAEGHYVLAGQRQSTHAVSRHSH